MDSFHRYGALVAGLTLLASAALAQTNELDRPDYSFAVAGDMRAFVGKAPVGKKYFEGACAALQQVGGGDFMVSPGDCDPPSPVRAALDQFLGTNYLWFPVAGNHETESLRTMTWLRQWAQAGIPHLARRGPPGAENTTYSFEFNSSHFVMLNEYFDGESEIVRKDDVPDVLLDWLEQDLAANRQPLVWIVGHKPIKSMADMDTGRLRHAADSVSTNKVHLERFLQILEQHRVRAYLCGHTHSSSVTKVRGIWQVDSGHARGGGDVGAPSTFLKVRVAATRAWVDVYRSNTNGVEYQLRRTVELDSNQ